MIKEYIMEFRISFGRILLLVSTWLLLFSCSKPEPDSKVIENDSLSWNYSPVEVQVLEMLNDFRLQENLSALTILDPVSRQAKIHNEHMLMKKEVCHHNFSARFSTLKTETGAKTMGENIAYGYSSAEAVVTAWSKSQAHRKAMTGKYTHVGVSVLPDKKGRLYFTSIFVRR